MSLSDYEKISNLIKNSFIDFVIQNNTTVREMIKPLLVDSQTAIVDQLEKAKQKYPSNQLLQDLVPVLGNREKSAKSITLKANIKDANSENFYTGMMRELRDSGEKDLQDLYENIINVSILQGTGQSAISIRNIIPLEDYADKIAPIFQQLQADSMLEPFENALFERNNFKNSEIFEDFKPIIWEPKPNPQTGIYEEKQYMFDPITGENKLIHVFPNYSITGFGESRTLIKLSEQYNSFQLSSDFIKVPKVISDKKGNKFNVTTGTEISKADYAYMMKKGDFNLFDAYYYKKVYTKLLDEFGNPIPLSTYTNAKVGREYYYKLINVYGDGDRAVEMNTNFTPSVIDNGSIIIPNEVSDEQIVSMINPGIEKQVVPLPTEEVITEPTQVTEESKNIEVVDRYSITDVQANPNKIYVFGDNTKRFGTGGQAQIRNNPNAMGIATKLEPSNEPNAFMSDKDLASNKEVIDGDIAKIKATGKVIVLPKDGFGTGLAKLKEKAPQTYAYLKQRLLEEFGFDNDKGTIAEQVVQPGEQLGLFGDTITLKNGKDYNKSDINSNMLEALGYTPKEIGKILKSIC
jgi:hypothetical protein